MAQERLQKVLAAAGIGSRRACEQIILEGRVKVNGQVVRDLPVLVDRDTDEIRVQGRRVRAERTVYFLLHKPKGVYCTNRDPAGRPRAIDLLPNCHQRLFPVGRLDGDSTGLLILTNDGRLAQRLTHPRYGVPKTYVAQIDGKLSPQEIEAIKHGVWLSEGKTGRAKLKLLRRGHERCLLEITIREGRNRQIRRMLAQVGHPVRKLTRVRIGPLSLRGLKPGKWRRLTSAEVNRLRALTG